jgi:hypothetical protein
VRSDNPKQTGDKAASQVAPVVSFVSLGCPKALVDSERIITRLRAEGYALTREHKGADMVIVNTCGFLDSAQEESLEAIGDALAENGKVIVTGCMGAEPEQIRERFPDIHPFDWHIDLSLGPRRVQDKVWQHTWQPGLTVYFVDQPGFYHRNGLYQEKAGDYQDNAERFIFFSR